MNSSADQPAPGVGHDPSVAARVERLYESHAALVRGVCRSLLRDRVEAEDAVQQTFLSAQRALLNGSSPRDAAAWLATIARHESLARVKARMREPLPLDTEEHDAAPDAHVSAVQRQEAGELRDALAELPTQQRQAILLREVRGLSYQEVASSLSLTTSAVESLLFRARRSLQLRLQEALAALSPAGWAQPLSDLGARLGGGGLAGPAAAKVAAVGVGTVIAAGGGIVGPTVMGLGHSPAPARTTATRAPAHHPLESAATKAPMTVWSPSPHHTIVAAAVRPPGAKRGEGGDSGSSTEASDRSSPSGTPEREASSGTRSASGDGSSRSGSTGERGDGGTTQKAAPDSGGDSQTGTTDRSGTTTSESGTAATDSGSGD